MSYLNNITNLYKLKREALIQREMVMIAWDFKDMDYFKSMRKAHSKTCAQIGKLQKLIQKQEALDFTIEF